MRYFSATGDPNLVCKCGECGLGFDDMSEAFMLRLDEARHQAGVPFVINSGIRCPEHNQRVSSSGPDGPDGPHTTGKAVDIRATDSRTRFRILQALIDAGFHRIGIARTFIHVDNSGQHDPEVVWLYD